MLKGDQVETHLRRARAHLQDVEVHELDDQELDAAGQEAALGGLVAWVVLLMLAGVVWRLVGG